MPKSQHFCCIFCRSQLLESLSAPARQFYAGPICNMSKALLACNTCNPSSRRIIPLPCLPGIIVNTTVIIILVMLTRQHVRIHQLSPSVQGEMACATYFVSSISQLWYRTLAHATYIDRKVSRFSHTSSTSRKSCASWRWSSVYACETL